MCIKDLKACDIWWHFVDAPAIPLGSLCLHRDALSDKSPIKMPPSTCPPNPGFYVFILYISQETARLSVCARQVRGSILQKILSLCGLPVSCCLATSVVWSRSAGPPRGLPSPRIFMVLGGMKAAFVPFPPPGSWRARRLDSADLDSRVWLASTRTYIACAVPFMVWIHSRLGAWVELIKRQQKKKNVTLLNVLDNSTFLSHGTFLFFGFF